MKKKSTETINQTQFRDAVSSRDKTCLISKFNECECDACHIVPLYICDQFGFPFQYDRCNGILMTKSLHALFDKFYWTFDIYDLIFKNKKYWCKLLISPNHLNLSVNYYKNQYINIPLECFPFMYVHYQIFIAYHHDMKIDILKLYQEIINQDKVFYYLYKINIPIQSLLEKNFRNFLIENKIIQLNHDKEYFVNAIIKHKEKSDQDYYFIWWDHLPYSDSSWEPQNNLNDQSIKHYNNFKEEVEDHSFYL